MSRDSHQRMSQSFRGLGISQLPRWQSDKTRTCHPQALMSCITTLSPSFHTPCRYCDVLAKLLLTVDSAALVGKVTVDLHLVIPLQLACNTSMRFYSNLFLLSFGISFYYNFSSRFSLLYSHTFFISCFPHPPPDTFSCRRLPYSFSFPTALCVVFYLQTPTHTHTHKNTHTHTDSLCVAPGTHSLTSR